MAKRAEKIKKCWACGVKYIVVFTALQLNYQNGNDNNGRW